jgi:hypothetical protein
MLELKNFLLHNIKPDSQSTSVNPQTQEGSSRPHHQGNTHPYVETLSKLYVLKIDTLSIKLLIILGIFFDSHTTLIAKLLPCTFISCI